MALNDWLAKISSASSSATSASLATRMSKYLREGERVEVDDADDFLRIQVSNYWWNIYFEKRDEEVIRYEDAGDVVNKSMLRNIKRHWISNY